MSNTMEMSETKGKIEKICPDNDCTELWEKFPADCAEFTKDFVYCPFCSEELNLQCSVCKESLSNKDFKYCPWCGAAFDL